MIVELRLEPKGPIVAREAVAPADLADARAEAWWNNYLRRGCADTPLGDIDLALRPLFREDKCLGFSLESRTPAGDTVRTVFPRTALEHVAARTAGELMRSGLLKTGALYYYTLSAEGDEDAEPLPPAEQSPPRHRSLVMSDLMDRAVPVGDTTGLHPVFYTRPALAQAERIARRGVTATPPVETGGVLVGALGACPESGEMFVVIEDVLEATDAEGKTFSLNYSSRTWARLDAVMKARQHRHPAQRILGQTHGHNFMPAGEPCAECATARVCGKSTAFLSADDVLWCRAVFNAQPWQASHVFGLNARKENVDAFYGQLGGGLVRRGFHLIDPLEADDG